MSPVDNVELSSRCTPPASQPCLLFGARSMYFQLLGEFFLSEKASREKHIFLFPTPLRYQHEAQAALRCDCSVRGAMATSESDLRINLIMRIEIVKEIVIAMLIL